MISLSSHSLSVCTFFFLLNETTKLCTYVAVFTLKHKLINSICCLWSTCHSLQCHWDEIYCNLVLLQILYISFYTEDRYGTTLFVKTFYFNYLQRKEKRVWSIIIMLSSELSLLKTINKNLSLIVKMIGRCGINLS